MPYRNTDHLFAIGQGECMRMTLLLLLTLAPAAALSNPLPLGGPGRSIVPFISKSSSIRLMEEHVSIRVGETREVPGFAPNTTMKTRCVSFTCAFSLRNSGPAHTLQVGFPFFSGRTSAGEGYGEVDDFRVSIDGRQAGPIKEQRRPMKEIIIFKERITGAIDVRLVALLLDGKKIAEIPGQPEMYDFSPLGHDMAAIRRNMNKINYGNKQKALLLDIIKEQVDRGDFSFAMYRNWYYFPVDFKAGATRKLVITYKSSNGNFPDRSFYYVLKSARLWSGPIGDCTVDIVFLDNNMDRYVIRPAGYTQSGPNAVKFKWSNFIPQEDIFVRFRDD